MNWRLSPLNSVILFICLTVVAWTVTEVPMIIISIIIVIRKVIFGGIVRQATLVILNMSSLIWYLTLPILNVLAAAVVVQLHAARWALYLYILVINIAAHRSCYVTFFLLTYIDFLLARNWWDVLVAWFILWDGWLVIIISIGTCSEHIIIVIKIICGIIIFVAIYWRLGVNWSFISFARSRNLLTRIIFTVWLILLILTTSYVTLSLLWACNIILRSLLHNITVSFLVVLQIWLSFLWILQIFSVLYRSLIRARWLLMCYVVLDVSFVVIN